MYSQEQRKLAIETFIKLDYSIADTVATLCVPLRAARDPASCMRIAGF